MIVVTAPTGQIGGRVVRRLLDAGEKVRVVVRDPARLAPAVAGWVEIARGSHGDPDVVGEAFAGADAVFWLAPPQPGAASFDEAYSLFARPAVDAFAAHRVPRVVGVSVLGRGAPQAARAGAVPAALAMDDLIVSSGVAYRALTMSYFMDNVRWQLDNVLDRGVLTFPSHPDRAFPVVATRDVADVAARLLCDRAWTGVEETPVLGPEDLTYDEMAVIMSEVLGRAVSYRQSPGEQYKATLTRYGYTDAMAQALLDMAVAKNDGLDDVLPRTPYGRTPTRFRDWFQAVAAGAGTGS